MATYRRVCSWCQVFMDGPEAGPVSHGVCAVCKRALLPEFLDTLPGAALLLDADTRVLSANRVARGDVGLDLDSLEGSPLADVFDCAEAMKAVTETFVDGSSRAAVTAAARTGRGPLTLSLSTRRVREGVLLLWDALPPNIPLTTPPTSAILRCGVEQPGSSQGS